MFKQLLGDDDMELKSIHELRTTQCTTIRNLLTIALIFNSNLTTMHFEEKKYDVSNLPN